MLTCKNSPGLIWRGNDIARRQDVLSIRPPLTKKNGIRTFNMATSGNTMLAVEREPNPGIIIGNKLKAELRREIAHLTAEWKTTICADRKRELERQITALKEMI
jgi:hypothetical protein